MTPEQFKALKVIYICIMGIFVLYKMQKTDELVFDRLIKSLGHKKDGTNNQAKIL